MENSFFLNIKQGTDSLCAAYGLYINYLNKKLKLVFENAVLLLIYYRENVAKNNKNR